MVGGVALGRNAWMKPMLRIGLRFPERLASVHYVIGIVALLGAGTLVHPPNRSWFAEPMRMTGHADMEPSAHPATIVTPVACTPLPDIAGKSITTALVHFPPDALTPEHRHPGSVTAYVLRGIIRSQIAGEKAETYSSGETWFEPPGAVHSFARNTSLTEDAELLATFVADAECGPLTIFE